MKHQTTIILAALLSLLAATSCDTTTDAVGAGLQGNVDHFSVSADSFNISTETRLLGAVKTECVNASLGRLMDYDTGSIISPSLTTQFYILPGANFPDTTLIRSCDPKSDADPSPISVEHIYADSACLFFYPVDIIGDSLQPLHLNIYELDKPLPDGTEYQSNFEVRGSEYLSKDKKPLKSVTMTMVDKTLDSTITSSSGYTTTFRVPLKEQYTAKDGRTYSNYGTYIMRRFYESQKNKDGAFDTFNKFVHNVCPGIYVEVDNGDGSMATLNGVKLNVTYRYYADSVTINATTSMFSTLEVLQTTCVSPDEDALKKLADDQDCTYLKTPAGLYTVATLPIIPQGNVPGIFSEEHKSDSVTSVAFSLQEMNYEGLGNNSYPKPSTLVLIPVDSIRTFFKGDDDDSAYLSKLALATRSATYGTYNFTDCSLIVSSLYHAYRQGIKNDPDWVAKHPQWNKLAIVPVTTTTDTSGNVNAVYHDMSFTTAKLVRGDASNPSKPLNIKMTVIYTKMTN